MRLAHMKRLGFSPRVIFDCGAFTGQWTLWVSRMFPGAQCVLFEPNAGLADTIRSTIAGIVPPPLLFPCAVGERPGRGILNIWGHDPHSCQGSSLLSHVQGSPDSQIETEITTLDLAADRINLAPDLVKLDLQGSEAAALRGAEHLLGSVELFIVEFGCLEAYEGRTTPKDLCDILYAHDYCLYDVADLIYRPYDGALTGGDFFFLKRSSRLRAYKGYR
jgi:FkbM family methyltransferase